MFPTVGIMHGKGTAHTHITAQTWVAKETWYQNLWPGNAGSGSKLKNGNCYILFSNHWWVIKQRLKLSAAIYSLKRSQPDNVLRWRCWAKLVPSWWWLGNVVCTGWHLGRPNSMRHGERTIIHGDGSPMRALLISCGHDFSTDSTSSNIISVPRSQFRFITGTINKSMLQSDGKLCLDGNSSVQRRTEMTIFGWRDQNKQAE